MTRPTDTELAALLRQLAHDSEACDEGPPLPPDVHAHIQQARAAADALSRTAQEPDHTAFITQVHLEMTMLEPFICGPYKKGVTAIKEQAKAILVAPRVEAGPTWEQRVERAAKEMAVSEIHPRDESLWDDSEYFDADDRKRYAKAASDIVRAAFPEYAPAGCLSGEGQ